MKLGYLVLEVRRPAAWRTFASGVLGLQPADENGDGSFGFRLDGAAHRLLLVPGKADDVAAIGLEVRDEGAYAELAARLAEKGVEAREGGAALRRARRVERLLAFQ